MFPNSTENDEKYFEKVKREYCKVTRFSKAAQTRGEIGLMVSCHGPTNTIKGTKTISAKKVDDTQKTLSQYTTSIQLLNKQLASGFPINIMSEQLVYLNWILSSITNGSSLEHPIFLVRGRQMD